MKSCGIVVEGMKKSGGDWDIQMDEEITKKSDKKRRRKKKERKSEEIQNKKRKEKWRKGMKKIKLATKR